MPYTIKDSTRIVPNMHLLTIEAPEVARALAPGQFVILRAEEGGERIPLTAADWDAEKGTLTVVFMTVGNTTHRLGTLVSGETIPTVVGPLGNPLVLPESSTVVCVGGCYGNGSIYPTARALKAKGNKVISVIEGRSAHLFFWEEKLKEVSDQIYTITRDGTRGYKGHIARNLPQVLEAVGEPVDQVIINGCNFLMKRASDATRPLGIKTLVSLNTLMIDGTGMCGVCRVSVAGKTKFACVDGPYFDGHLVDWDELVQRRRTYLKEETVPLRSSAAEPRTEPAR
jgi:ferredoxin/flavodoxin---NADP+ reductase